jgi:aromatic ring-opening dioxygenase catalytic subunit (LigB family)
MISMASLRSINYEYKFLYKGSPKVAKQVIEKLTDAGIKVDKVSRGFDHGLWASFIVGQF